MAIPPGRHLPLLLRPFLLLLALALVIFPLSALLLLYTFSWEQQPPREQRQIEQRHNNKMISNNDNNAIGDNIPDDLIPVPSTVPSTDLQNAVCIIDDKQRVPCARNGTADVFLPLNGYLKKHFDVSGHFDAEKSDHFHYYTSDWKTRATVANKQQNYHPLEQFNDVALRLCVKCLSPENGLPMSMQWEPTRKAPYFYPVQVLQFGLEHLVKKNRTMAPPPTIVDLSERIVQRTNDVMRTSTSIMAIEQNQSVKIKLYSDPALPVLFFSWQANSPEAWFEILFTNSKISNGALRLEFRQTESRNCVWQETGREEGNELHFVYGLNSSRIAGRFHEFMLDMPLFVTKALALANESQGGGECRRGHQHLQNDFVPTNLHLFGHSQLKVNSIRQQSSANAEIVERVAQWLLESQDEKGGWAVPIRRTFLIDGGQHRLVLEPGWHNAMAQGHALSFLSRVFAATNNQRYAQAAQRALALFDVPASAGGILNRLFSVDWYEEFPVHQHSNGTFVLNGFLYALIGLHEFSMHSNRSQELFWHGMHSLRILLPMFDCGIRSTYDLRHIPLGSRPNIARWDYHALHVVQLEWLHRKTNEPLLRRIAKRWADYANGLALKHN